MVAFTDYDLLPTLQATLAEKGLVALTEIQNRALPLLLDGSSVVGVSETGSGKTLAYALPILHRLKTLENDGLRITDNGKPRGLVVVPTRELGEQVSRVFKLFTHTTRLRVRTVLGGTKLDVAKENVSGPFEVLVATPGRMLKLIERKLVDLSEVSMLVFDEADQMLDKGFLSDAKRIVEACPSDRQLALFSATVSPTVQTLMKELFVGVEVIRSSGSHRVVATLKTVNREVVDGKRVPLLSQVLRDKVEGGTLLFTNTREQCDILADEIRKLGLECVIYRGEMEKVERRANLKAFRDGAIPLMIATDLAARGLDIEHVGRVINYHLPKEQDVYLHRVGRTARAGRSGMVINFVTERDEPLIAALEGRAAVHRPKVTRHESARPRQKGRPAPRGVKSGSRGSSRR